MKGSPPHIAYSSEVPMTVAELIALLENENADATILVNVEGATREISHLESIPQEDGELEVHIMLPD
jgi:hypothetical protein